MEFKERLRKEHYTIEQLEAMLDVLNEVDIVNDLPEDAWALVWDQMATQVLKRDEDMDLEEKIIKQGTAAARCAVCRHALCSVSDYPCIECYCNSKWEEMSNNA